MKMTDRIKHAWNAFTTNGNYQDFRDYGPSNSRPQHKNHTMFNAASYTSTIFNRIAMDAMMTKFKHVKVNFDNEDEEDIKSGLHNCLTMEANIDQNHMQFIHDLVFSMFDDGVVAVVPVDTTISPKITGGYDILSLRVGKIMQWYPKHVEIELYNDNTGINERVTLAKKDVAIIENPLYSVVNSENSTLKRLMRKLNQLDNVDDLVSAGRLDLLISVPYAAKTELQQKAAESRIISIEQQLNMGRNGIAYINATEKVTQLNRPSNPQLLESINNLSQQFHNQLGLTASIFDGTASESEMRNYYTRTIDVIIENVVLEFNRKFLTKTARTQGHTIKYYRDMFKMVPVEIIAQLGDTFRRNGIATSNEVRRIIGLKPSNDKRADELFNPNMADDKQSNGIGSLRKPEDPGSVTSPDNSQNGDTI